MPQAIINLLIMLSPVWIMLVALLVEEIME